MTSPLFELNENVCSAQLETFGNSYGLFTLFVKSSDASVVSKNIKEIITLLKIGKDISSAKAVTKVSSILKNELSELPIALQELNLESVKSFKLCKCNYVAVGDVSNLPYLNEF